MKPLLVTGLLAVIAVTGATAQTPEATDAVRVFLDCPNFFCDPDFYRREIAFVDYVRDRQDSDVHILIRTQRTGANGQDFDIAFIGLRQFEGSDLSLGHSSSPTDTEDERRRSLAHVLKMGLMRYVANTPVAERIDIVYREADAREESRARPADDPWNFWVFRIGGNGSFNSEESTKRYNVGGSLSANRTTDDWKLDLRVNGNYNRSTFTLTDGSEFVNTTRNWGFRNLLVRSITDHWSAGGNVNVTASTFANQDRRVRVAPAVEFNVYPYSESSARRFAFLYTVGVNFVSYEEVTIFGETEETLFDQELRATAEFTQPWGTINLTLTGSTFLHDLARNRVDFGGGFNFRVIRGLNFNAFGSVSRIRDQLEIAAQGVSDEDILLQRRQLETGFRYFVRMGFSYTFGSIFNNVVNPRFGTGGFFFF